MLPHCSDSFPSQSPFDNSALLNLGFLVVFVTGIVGRFWYLLLAVCCHDLWKLGFRQIITVTQS
jgi:hypothetical protein